VHLQKQCEEEAEKHCEQRKVEEHLAAGNPIAAQTVNGKVVAPWRWPLLASPTPLHTSRYATTQIGKPNTY
jgi:hypothetical protein